MAKFRYQIVVDRWYVQREVELITKILKVPLPAKFESIGGYGINVARVIDPKNELTQCVSAVAMGVGA